MSTRTTTMRRPKWRPTPLPPPPPPPPPSPKIINLPRRTRRKQPGNVVVKPPLEVVYNYRGKLENLFGEEREFSRTMLIVLLNSSERRERVAEECELESSGGGVDGFMEIEKPHDFFPSGGGGIDDDPNYGLYQFFDIDTVTVQRYESLKDVLATSPKPSIILSMTWNRRESWQEIPIKDPLVQHAAWAYLLSGSPSAPEGNDRKLTDGCWVFLVI